MRYDRQIKIKIDEDSFSKEYLESLSTWENEGGTAPQKNIMTSAVEFPIKPGQIFEVVEGELIFEEDEPYYLVRLSLLSLE